MDMFIALLMLIPVVGGFINSRDRRHVDRRYFAAFVGFSAAVVALIATILGILATRVWSGPPYYHPVRQNFEVGLSLIGSASTSVALAAGLISKGIWRVAPSC